MTSGDPVTSHPATGDPATGDPATGDPATGHPAPSHPATGDPATGGLPGERPDESATGSLPGELPDELATLWYLVRRVAALMDQQGETLLRRELDVSLAQFLVLSVVDAHPGPLSQQAIADRVGLTKGSVSRQIDQAVAAGLMDVRVAAHTRREHAVTLTEAGTALVRRGDALTEASRAALRDAADPPDLAAAIRALGSLLKVLEP